MSPMRRRTALQSPSWSTSTSASFGSGDFRQTGNERAHGPNTTSTSGRGRKVATLIFTSSMADSGWLALRNAFFTRRPGRSSRYTILPVGPNTMQSSGSPGKWPERTTCQSFKDRLISTANKPRRYFGRTASTRNDVIAGTPTGWLQPKPSLAGSPDPDRRPAPILWGDFPRSKDRRCAHTPKRDQTSYGYARGDLTHSWWC
jgi:hypothetical protein